tara:strand:- start:368 stop:655 length:288 start_codon:yes stop_codon:yes gene_type:complete
MTLFYETTNTWSSQPKPSAEDIQKWEYAAEKKNWRITQLPNDFYQTEILVIDTTTWRDVTRRETIEEAENAIDNSIQFYKKKLDFLDGPKVVKTF